ncbi:MAG: hypothetical protein KAS32_26525 [Candidatus Peribacteraceae bacterium]|nr:hypothetical protein [Candidatus Peribacteraceae bacterium]
MSKVCIYHGGTIGGICSAAIIKSEHPDTKLIPVTYDMVIDPHDIIKEGDDVIMVDFVLQPFQNMVELSGMCNLTWIDHHDTSIMDYYNYTKENPHFVVEGERSVDMASCELTWRHIHPEETIPYTVWLIGQYDLGIYDTNETVLPFQFGVKLDYRDPSDLQFWYKIFTKNRDSKFIQNIIKDGRTIIRYRKTLNKKISDTQTFESRMFDHRCICINRALCGSTVFDGVYDPNKHDIMVVFYICKSGTWNISLYSNKEGVHVGNIAKMYGGGGYDNAAGFRCSLLPFEVIG